MELLILEEKGAGLQARGAKLNTTMRRYYACILLFV